VEGDYMAQEIFIHRKPGRFSIDGERYSQETTIEKVQVNKSEPLKKELKTFLRAVRDRKPFTVTPQQALRNMVICEQIHAGIKKHGQMEWTAGIGLELRDNNIFLIR
jgi:predicted dehydrogenase